MMNNPFIPDPDPQAIPELLSQGLITGRRLRTRVITLAAYSIPSRVPPPGIPRADDRDGGLNLAAARTV
eukprot:13794233-Alexandrium_andersonii.AAC.1